MRSLPTGLLNNTYLGIESIDRRTIEAVTPELARLGGRRVALLATVDASRGMRARGDLWGSGVDRRVCLGLALAACRVRAVLRFTMRLPADWASSMGSTSDSRVAPTPVSSVGCGSSAWTVVAAQLGRSWQLSWCGLSPSVVGPQTPVDPGLS